MPRAANIVTAFVVLRDPADATPETVTELQDFVKAEIAPYKYPRAIEFVTALPYTETGKLQRFRLRQGDARLPQRHERAQRKGRENAARDTKYRLLGTSVSLCALCVSVADPL